MNNLLRSTKERASFYSSYHELPLIQNNTVKGSKKFYPASANKKKSFKNEIERYKYIIKNKDRDIFLLENNIKTLEKKNLFNKQFIEPEQDNENEKFSKIINKNNINKNNSIQDNLVKDYKEKVDNLNNVRSVYKERKKEINQIKNNINEMNKSINIIENEIYKKKDEINKQNENIKISENFKEKLNEALNNNKENNTKLSIQILDNLRKIKNNNENIIKNNEKEIEELKNKLKELENKNK